MTQKDTVILRTRILTILREAHPRAVPLAVVREGVLASGFDLPLAVITEQCDFLGTQEMADISYDPISPDERLYAISGTGLAWMHNKGL